MTDIDRKDHSTELSSLNMMMCGMMMRRLLGVGGMPM